MARELGFPVLAGLLAAVPACFMMCRCEPLRSSGYGHMADGVRGEQAVHRTACSGFRWPAVLGAEPAKRRGDHWLSACSGPCTAYQIRGQSQLARTLLIQIGRSRDPFGDEWGDAHPDTPKTQYIRAVDPPTERSSSFWVTGTADEVLVIGA